MSNVKKAEESGGPDGRLLYGAGLLCIFVGCCVTVMEQQQTKCNGAVLWPSAHLHVHLRLSVSRAMYLPRCGLMLETEKQLERKP